MTNEEIIDSYLTGRMSDPEKAAFEDRLNADPNLRGEFAFEKVLVEGIQKARAAQLKTMLAQIPITSATVGGGTTSAILKIASAVLITGAIGTGAYLYLSPPDDPPAVVRESVQPFQPTESPDDSQSTEPEAAPAIDNKQEEDSKTAKDSPKPADKPIELKSTKPKLDLVDPTGDTPSETVVETPKSPTPATTISESELEVEVGNTYSKKYSFHYQFRNGKLLLYGPFDKSLYEILEIHHGDSQSTFLFYKNLYYPIDQQMRQVTALKAVENEELIQKLREFRKE